MLSIGRTDDIIRATKKILISKFEMKYLGIADVILGIKISRTEMTLFYLKSTILQSCLKSLIETMTVFKKWE